MKIHEEPGGAGPALSLSKNGTGSMLGQRLMVSPRAGAGPVGHFSAGTIESGINHRTTRRSIRLESLASLAEKCVTRSYCRDGRRVSIDSFNNDLAAIIV